MRSSHNNFDQSEVIFALATVNPNNVIPDLEQSVEVAKLNLSINPNEETKEKVRDLMFLLNFFRVRRLRG